MGNKFERFSIVFFIFLMIFSGVFIASVWGASITVMNIEEFEVEDNIILINGTIEEITQPNEDILYIKINGKVYDLGVYFWESFKSSEKDISMFYYTIEIGDNITVYKSWKIVLNGDIYQNGVFEDFSWFAWLITFIPVVIIVIGLIVSMIFVGYGKKELKIENRELSRKNDRLKREKNGVTKKLEEEKRRCLVLNNTQKSSVVSRALYCNNCGSKGNLNDLLCKYCGTEVRLE